MSELLNWGRRYCLGFACPGAGILSMLYEWVTLPRVSLVYGEVYEAQILRYHPCASIEEGKRY